MLLHIPEVLTAEQVQHARTLLDKAQWVDGKVTAGYQSGKVKDNLQLPEGCKEAEELGDMIVKSLTQNALFMSAALPLHIFPPLFNRYEGGGNFGTHVDNAIRYVPGTNFRIRTDLSATLFFYDPEEYEGGELVIEDTFGTHNVKLPAGDMILYPSSSLHHVTPVTKGARISSFFWIQSLVRDDAQRTMLFDMDNAIQRLNEDKPEHPSVVQLTGIYHNLLRSWSNT